MRNISKALVIVGLLAPSSGHTLGIGEIKLRSYLNQPLEAEVPLVLSREQLSQLRIGLATPAEFARVGLTRSPTLTKLRFAAVQRPDGSFVVRVRSTEAISEPFLSFVMELTWPEGRTLRSFTVLLDPPPNEPTAVGQPIGRTAFLSERAAENPDADDAPAVTDALPVTGRRNPAVVPTEGYREIYGPVARNETLWRLAERLKPAPSIPTHRMMMALFRSNPQAFSRPNVNALNAGAYLRIPGRDELLALADPSVRGESYAASSVEAHHDPEARFDTHPRPALGNPDRAPENGAGSAIEKLRRENEQLRTRMSQLEQRVTELTQLLDERTRVAKPALTDAIPSVVLPPPLPAVTEGPGAGRTPASRDIDAGSAQVDAIAPAAAPQAISPMATSTATTPQSAPSLAPGVAPAAATDSSAENDQQATRSNSRAATSRPPPVSAGVEYESPDRWQPWLLGLSATLFASLLGLYARQRHLKRLPGRISGAPQEDAAEEPILSKPASRSSPAGIINPAATEPAPDSTDTSSRKIATRERDILAAESPDADADALFEADIYLSYGKYAQAEEALQKAIERSPARPEYYLKLLEIYAAAKNADAFEMLAQTLRAKPEIDQPEFWTRVSALGRALDLQIDNPEPGRSKPSEEATPKPHSDEHDRLIAKLKQFSLETRPENSAASGERPSESSGPPAHSRSSLPPEQPAPRAGEASNLELASESDPPERAEGADAHLIPYIPASRPSGPSEAGESSALNQAAAKSIDDLLKELSAMHFEEHHSAPPAASGEQAASPERELGDDLMDEQTDGVLSAEDMESKLDLARAYADMSDFTQARLVLSQVIAEGTGEQRLEAEALLARLS